MGPSDTKLGRLDHNGDTFPSFNSALLLDVTTPSIKGSNRLLGALRFVDGPLRAQVIDTASDQSRRKQAYPSCDLRLCNRLQPSERLC